MTDLPPGWDWVELQDLAAGEPRAMTDGPFGSNLKASHYTDAGPRVIRLQNIGFGEFIDERAHISDGHYEQLRAHEARAGDLVVASLGQDLPRACLIPPSVGPAIVKADCIRVHLSPEVDSRFVNYALQRPELHRAVAEKIHGVGRPRLGMNGIRELSVPLPPRAEQERIIAAIEEHLSRLAAAEEAVRSVERRLERFERSIVTSTAATVAPLPHWDVLTVAEAGSVGLGLQRSPKRHRGPNMRPYLRVANVFEDRIDATDVMTMDMSDDEWERYRLLPGDVLLNEGQTPELLGRPAIYRGEPPDVAFTNSLLRFRPHAGIDAEWALLVFRSHMHNRRFMRESQITTNIAHLSAGRFKAVEFPVPPPEEQRSRVAAAREALEACSRVRAEAVSAAAKAATLRRSILAAAFSGKLVPQDPDDEPASALLDRIRADRASATPKKRGNRRRADANAAS